MASLADVAREAGVSISTASVVLNPGKKGKMVSEEVAARVRQAAEALGYVPNYHARSMRLGRAETIGVALDTGVGRQPPEMRLGNSYFGGLVSAIEVEAGERGYAMTVVGTAEGAQAPQRGLMMCRQRRLDGLIVLAVMPPSVANPFFQAPPEQAVVAIQYAGETPIPVVTWDEERAIALVVGHLAELGHRSLLWIGYHTAGYEILGDPREDIFIRAAWDAGVRGASLRMDERPSSSSLREGTVDAVVAALGEHLHCPSRERFTAIVCYNDCIAAGACNALLAAGLRVPQDVSVVGFDNMEARTLAPKLTSVDHMLEPMGRRATAMLIEMVEHPEQRAHYVGRREVIQPVLIVRNSTAAPGAGV